SLGIVSGQGTFRTTDAGRTWINLAWINLGIQSSATQPLALTATKTFFALSTVPTTAIVQTNDAGNNWTVIATFPSDTISTGCIRGDSCHLIIQLRSGAYLSTDKGRSWVWLQGPPPTQYNVSNRRFFYKNKIVFMSTI